MQFKTEELKNLKKLKAIPIIIVLLIGAVMGIKTSVALWSKNTKLKADIIKKTEELAKSADISSLKRTVDTEIKELEEKISAIEKKFPSSNIEEVFSSLNRFIEASQISLKSISPLEKTEAAIPASKDKYLELPINLRLECSYSQLASFLNKIENTDKIMFVTEVKIQSNSSNIWEHNIELSLKVPMLLLQSGNKDK